MRIKFSEQEELKIEDYYVKHNKTLREIGDIMGVSRTPIARVLKERGVEFKPPHSRRKYSLNESFFKKVDNPSKAYWLGFIYADGCVFRRSLLVRLAKRDEKHLTKLKKALSSSNPITNFKQNSFGVEVEMVKLEANSTLMIKDLQALGVHENKSKTIRLPSSEVVPPHLLNHFVRGYFDGDGSIYKDGERAFVVSFEGNLDFIKELAKLLGVSTKITMRNNSYRLRFGGNLQVMRVLDWVYRGSLSSNRLDRKYKTYVELKEMY